MCKEINKNKYSQFFILFLKRNDCYKQFIENCRKVINNAMMQLITKEDVDYDVEYFYHIWQKYRSIPNYLLIQSPDLFLQDAFLWANTTQGNEYWINFHKKWLKSLDKYKGKK